MYRHLSTTCFILAKKRKPTIELSAIK
uniref:Uncharacterized protein n=1 Tax=Heterorhabditis bacteriophora TaxID=37862 RepID=A0A1I7WHB6_HETBA